MNNREKQQQEELTVFNEFAKVCPLPLMLETVRLGPDPPDIVCDLESCETLGFELVSAEDVTRGNTHQQLVPWTKNLNDSMELQNALYKEYRAAVAAGRIERPEQFEYYTVTVYFEDGASCRRRMGAVPQVIELMNQRGPGRHSIRDGVIRSIRCELYPVASSLKGPCFSIPSGCGVRLYIVERVKEMVHASHKYKSNNRFHLLAWSTTACHAESEMWRDDLVRFLRSDGMGTFYRIWVFGFGDKLIVFDSNEITEVGAIP